MRKLFLTLALIMSFALVMPALATTQNDTGAPPGQSDGLGGTPDQGGNMGSNDKLVGNASPQGECEGPSCIKHVNPTADASPYDGDVEFYNTSNSTGMAYGSASGYSSITAFAQGTKTAFTGYTPNPLAYDPLDPTATGDADFASGAFEIKDPGNFIVSGIGAKSELEVAADGTAVGIDKKGKDKTDYASIDIALSGNVHQATTGFTSVGPNWYGGNQQSSASFNANDWDSSNGTFFGIDSLSRTAVAYDSASAEAMAAGGTIGGLKKLDNGVAGGVVTAGTASWDTSGAPSYHGNVQGTGDAQMNIQHVNGGSSGQVYGSADYCFTGYDNGSGIAGINGKVTIDGSSVTSTVNAFSMGTSNDGRQDK